MILAQSTTDGAAAATGAAGVGATVVLFAFAAYFLPTLIAIGRRHSSAYAIAAVNILVGWTFIGWVVAFVWSVKADPRVLDVNVTNPGFGYRSTYDAPQPVAQPTIAAAPVAALANEKDCPSCLSRIPRAATVCRYCQRDVPPDAA